MKTQSTLNRIGAALLIAALAGTAVAADPSSTSKSDESDVLRGPEVTQSSSVESTDTMTGKTDRAKGEGQNAQRAAELPMTAFVNAVRGLRRAAQDNPELALSDDQMAQIKEIAEGYKAKMDDFLDEHRDELGPMYAQRENRQAPRDAQNERARDQQDGEDKADAPERPEQPSMTRQEMKELRAKRAEIMKNAPSGADEKKQIFALLTSDQRAAVKEQISKVQEARARRTGMAMGRGGNNERAQGRAEGRGERGSKDKERAPRREIKEDD